MLKAKRSIIAVLKYITLIFGAFVSVLPIIVCVITAYGSRVQKFNHYPGMRIGRFDSDRLHAGICTEPFQIQRKRTGKEYVLVCVIAAGYRDAGIRISDHVQPGMD